MQIKIATPDPHKIDENKLQRLFTEQFLQSAAWKDFQKKQTSPVYKSWEQMRFTANIPGGLNAEEAFFLLSLLRETTAKPTPIVDIENKPFIWEELSRFRYFCDDFAKNFGVHKAQESLTAVKQDLRRKKIFEGTIEEAIASSQIEGAVITRQQGKELLETKRKPKTLSEKMVFNNYQTIVRIENEWKHRAMSIDLLLEIQASLTQDTLAAPDQVGRWRTDSDGIVVGDTFKDEVALVPPPAKQLHKELGRFVRFANEELECKEYFGDLPRAIMLHFWLAYLHPFCDGNGRTARAVFYWYLLRKNYLYIGFLPVSTRIRQAKRGYEKAFLLAEQDRNNLTYFFDYIIKQLQLSIQDFEAYEQELAKKEVQKRSIAQQYSDLNARQVELIRYFAAHPDDVTTFQRHQVYHGITYVTARKDILNLQEKGLLASHQHGRKLMFSPTEKVHISL